MNLLKITYNHLNLPVKINFANGGQINYIYDANGKKLSKKVLSAGAEVLTEYQGAFQYAGGVLDFIQTAEGYVKRSMRLTTPVFNYMYNYKDHLGNVRVSFSGTARDPKIMEENHYYPFGLKHEKYNSDTYEFVELAGTDGYYTGIELAEPNVRNSYQYKYNGKEFQDELGLNMYDYGARNYDPAIGRWMNMDALSEKYPNVSTYAYVANMPTIAVDPDGNQIILVTSSGTKLQYKNGNAYHYGTDKVYVANGNSTIDKTIRSYQKIESSNNKILTRTLHWLENSDLKHTVYESREGRNAVKPAKGSTYTDGTNERTDTDTFLDLSQGRKNELKESTGLDFSDLDIVVHEMSHQYDYDIGNMADSDMKSSAKSPTEIRAVYMENIAREIENLGKRTKYGKENIDPAKLDNPPSFLPPIYFPEIKFSNNIFNIINGRHPSAN